MAHDPMCRWPTVQIRVDRPVDGVEFAGCDCTRCDESECCCDFIAKVRADATIKALEFCCADTEPDIRKRVAEEIAQAIERMAPEHPKTWNGKWLVGRRMAANVARRIGGAS